MEEAGFLEVETMPRARAASELAQPMVRHFRQTFLWPICLLPLEADAPVQDHCAYLLHSEPGSPWAAGRRIYGGSGRLSGAALQ
jgi:hypothetical protein